MPHYPPQMPHSPWAHGAMPTTPIPLHAIIQQMAAAAVGPWDSPLSYAAAAMAAATPNRTPLHATPQTAAAPRALASGTLPGAEKVYGSRLERELAMATKEQLVQVVMELTALSPQVANYIESKAQIFGLQRASTSSCPSDTATPAKTDSTPVQNRGNANTSDDFLRTPIGELQRDLHERHTLPEKRAFGAELHPCIRQYGHCRNLQSCVFSQCPRNLCLNWLRGQCANGADCPHVHRLPDDAPESLRHLAVLHGLVKAEEAAVAALPEATPKETRSPVSDVAAQAPPA